MLRQYSSSEVWNLGYIYDNIDKGKTEFTNILYERCQLYLWGLWLKYGNYGYIFDSGWGTGITNYPSPLGITRKD